MCMSHMLSAVTNTHTHMYIYLCARTHTVTSNEISKWYFHFPFPQDFFERLAHIFSSLFSFLFCISNSCISSLAILNFASISIHCKYIELRLTQLYTLKLQQKMYLIATKYNYNVFDQLCHIPLASPWPVL